MSVAAFGVRFAITIALALSLPIGAAAAETVDYCADNVPAAYEEAVATLRPSPDYPKEELNRTGEGWVRFEAKISPEGVPLDIIIDDAVGGSTFINVSRNTFAKWRYTPAKHNGRPVTKYGHQMTFSYRFEGPVAAYKDLVITRYKRARKYLLANDPNAAIQELSFALKFPMTTYERSMASLLLAIAHFQLKDTDTATMHIRHALADEGYYLEKGPLSEALALGVILEAESGNYKAALCNYQTLTARDPEKAKDPQVAELAADITNLLSDAAPILIPGKVTPEPAEGASPSWKHPLLRERFTFSQVPPVPLNVRFVCKIAVIEGVAVKDKIWSAPPNAGSCVVHVTGPVGTTFELAELR